MPGPSRQSVLKPRRANSRPQKKMLISLALSMPLTTTTVGAGPGALRRHEQRRQRGALVGHLDELDVRMAQPDALVPDLVGVGALRLLLGAGRDEALGVVVVDAGAQIIVAGGDLAALGERVVAALLDLVAERAPFLEPGLAAVRLALARAQLLAAAVDLLQRHHAVGRHAFEDEGGVRPEEIVAEVIDPGTARGHSFRAVVELVRHSRWIRTSLA